MLSLEGPCSNGDVSLEDDDKALIFWDNQWSHICGYPFENNNVGFTLFCQKMGYHSDRWSGGFYGSPKDFFRVGKCNNGDTWENCQGGCNDYQAGGPCSNAKHAHAKCDKTQGAGVAIGCKGGESTKTTSCGGEILYSFRSRILTLPY